VRCGEPVDLSLYRDRPVDAALLREVTDLVMGRVRGLLAEVRAEPAPAGFFRRSEA
jgi:1-acyl-sn-glycerol-3-phosphate acyltransferase